MLTVARLALGAVHADVDLRPLAGALRAAWENDGVCVQPFLSRACLDGRSAQAALTERGPRHLDSWVMSREVCLELFEWNCRGADLALVEGEFCAGSRSASAGSQLERLCEWLDLPRLAVLDVSGSNGSMHVPPPPAARDAATLDGVIVDGLRAPADFPRWQANVEAHWGLPVLGGMESLPDVRKEALCGIDAESSRAFDLLAQSLARCTDLERLHRLASRRPLKGPTLRLPAPWTPPRSRVAVAYDDVFHCYFPDVLERLQARGAELLDFSPLHDGQLPRDVDLVYLGCGHPERFAARLAENECMKVALAQHVRRGGRVYAEGGGLPYLCAALQTADGVCHPMSGLLPAVAAYEAPPRRPVPVEATLARRCWLGEVGDRVRGYRQSPWRVLPDPGLTPALREPGEAWDLLVRGGVIASRLHLDFAAEPRLLTRLASLTG